MQGGRFMLNTFEASLLPNGTWLTTTDVPIDQEVNLTARFAAGTAAALRHELGAVCAN